MTAKILGETKIPFLNQEQPPPIMWIGEFGESTAQEFFLSYTNLHNDDKIHAIMVYVDSLGGDLNALATITELIETSEKPIITVGIGKAFSAGAMLVSMGHERWLAPNSRMMFHFVGLDMELEGMNPDGLNNLSKELERVNNMWLKKVVKRSKMTWKDFNKKIKDCGGEWYLNAKEAKEYGFIDEIGVPKLTAAMQWRVE